MIAQTDTFSKVFVSISIVFGSIALLLACVGVGTPNWQIEQLAFSGHKQLLSTANFFYSCRYFSNGTLRSCESRINNRNINQYYPVDAPGNQTEWNQHLDSAAGLSIVGIIFLFFGILTTLFMFCKVPMFIYLFGPVCFFLASLFMLGGMAEGAYVLYYNDYSANLYQTAHLLTIFSFLIDCIVAGRLPLALSENEFEMCVRK